MEDLQSETSSFHYTNKKKDYLSNKFYSKIGCEEGLYELSNYNHCNHLDFEQLELKLPLHFEDNKDNLFGITEEQEDEGEKVNFKEDLHLASDLHFDIKSTTSSHKKSKEFPINPNRLKSSFNVNKNYEKISMKTSLTSSTNITPVVNKNIELVSLKTTSEFSLESKLKAESFDNDSETLNLFKIAPEGKSDIEQDKKACNNKDLLFLNISNYLYNFSLANKISSTRINEVNSEATFIEEFTKNLCSKNIFDIIIFALHSYFLKKRKTLINQNISYSIFLKIFTYSPSLSCKDTKDQMFNGNKNVKISNMRKRAKTFFNNILIKLLNSLILIIIKDLPLSFLIKSVKFSDPYRKNNDLSISTIDMFKSFSSQGDFFVYLVNKILKDEINFSSKFEVLLSQLMISLSMKIYEDNYSDFYSSILYKTVLLNNIRISHGESFSDEFNKYAQQFTNFANNKKDEG